MKCFKFVLNLITEGSCTIWHLYLSLVSFMTLSYLAVEAFKLFVFSHRLYQIKLHFRLSELLLIVF